MTSDNLFKINWLSQQVCRPTRGITADGDRTFRFTLSKQRFAKGRTIMQMFSCVIVKQGDNMRLIVNNREADDNDEERVYCMLSELYKSKLVNKNKK
jgi:hypothetical protein